MCGIAGLMAIAGDRREADPAEMGECSARQNPIGSETSQGVGHHDRASEVLIIQALARRLLL
jgi:hypothetical protein